jgi:hypothetical protein
MPGIAARRPNNHHHSISKKSNRLEASLAMVPPRVLHGDEPAKTIAASAKFKPR